MPITPNEVKPSNFETTLKGDNVASLPESNPFYFGDVGDELMWKKVRTIGFRFQPVSSFKGQDGRDIEFGAVYLDCLVPYEQPHEGFAIGMRCTQYKISLVGNDFLSMTPAEIFKLNDNHLLPCVVEIGFIEVQKKKGTDIKETDTVQKAVDFRFLVSRPMVKKQ